MQRIRSKCGTGRFGLLATLGLLGGGVADAQTSGSVTQVIELDYSPAAPLPGLDLRSGRYLLDLRGPLAGPYQGVLYGPNNEVVDDRLSISASGCTTGVPATGQLTTQAHNAQPSINPLGLSVTSSGGCQLSGNAHVIGLSILSRIPDPKPNCNPYGEPLATREDPGPLCMEIEPGVNFAANLQPEPGVWIAGQPHSWGDSIELPSTAAVAKSAGRCYFNYSYRVRNIGVASSRPTSNALNLKSAFNPQLDLRALPALAPGALGVASGQFALPPGRWYVVLHVDSTYAVAELNGGDNFKALRVGVTGSCDSTTQ